MCRSDGCSKFLASRAGEAAVRWCPADGGWTVGAATRTRSRAGGTSEVRPRLRIKANRTEVWATDLAGTVRGTGRQDRLGQKAEASVIRCRLRRGLTFRRALTALQYY